MEWRIRHDVVIWRALIAQTNIYLCCNKHDVLRTHARFYTRSALRLNRKRKKTARLRQIGVTRNSNIYLCSLCLLASRFS